MRINIGGIESTETAQEKIRGVGISRTLENIIGAVQGDNYMRNAFLEHVPVDTLTILIINNIIINSTNVNNIITSCNHVWKYKDWL